MGHVTKKETKLLIVFTILPLASPPLFFLASVLEVSVVVVITCVSCGLFDVVEAFCRLET